MDYERVFMIFYTCVLTKNQVIYITLNPYSYNIIIIYTKQTIAKITIQY